MTYEPVLIKDVREPNSYTLDFYLKNARGYEALKKALTPKPKYIACNADESEPGTFKDHVLMERNPHLLIEGCAIGCYAIGAKVAYIYIRGEFLHVQRVLETAIADAYARGFLGA